MSEKHRNAQKSMPQSRKLFKYQKRKIRRYLKRVRWRRKRRQRYFLYGLALAVSMYLASIWKMRERIWSIREMDVIEYELPEMAKRCQVSFDFSERTDPDYLARVCPYVTYAFFSGSHMTQEEIEALMDRCHALGTKVVGVTLGSRGSIFSEEGKRYHQGIVPVEAIDTMGAGDSFIAGFLTRRILGDGMEDALRFAATAAANTCKFHGGFGYPHPLD